MMTVGTMTNAKADFRMYGSCSDPIRGAVAYCPL